MSNPSPPTNEDQQHLQLLAILHYAVAGMFALSGCSLVLMIGWMRWLFLLLLKVVYGIEDLPPDAHEVLDQKMPIVVGSFVALCWVHASVVAWFGRQIALRKHRRLCLVFEVLHCIAIPIGTALSILTIMALRRPTVKVLFDAVTITPQIGEQACPPTSPT